MPRPLLIEARDDFRGGRNTAVNPERLRVNELVDAQNVRLGAELGAIVKRSGSRRMHPTALPATINGVVQWDWSGGKQIVAISNGDLYHKTSELGEFTQVDPGVADAFSTTVPASFAPFRSDASGAPLELFIASGGKLYKWTGSVLTRIDGVTNAPTADFIMPYHTRMFAHDVLFLKNISWSKLGTAVDFTAGVGTFGGEAFVDVLSGESLVALEVVGSSLLMSAEDSVMRFTGHSADDIQIAEDTEGVSAEMGVVGALALKRFENVAFGISDRGPIVVSEQSAARSGINIEPDFDALDRANLAKSVVGGHRGRREVWNAVPGAADSGLNKTVYVFSATLQCWMGPWTYPFGITYLARFEDANGDEWIIAGCSDGFVRHMDTGAKDDVTSAGTGGTNISMIAELPPIFFQAGPGTVKQLKRIFLQADLPAASALGLEYSFDGAAFSTLNPASLTPGTIKSYRLDPLASAGQGKRLRLRLVDASAELPAVYGLLIEAWLYGRTY